MLRIFTVRRFVSPAFRQSKQNKNQPFSEGLQAECSRLLRHWTNFQCSRVSGCFRRRGSPGWWVYFSTNSSFFHQQTSSFYHTISVECLVEETVTKPSTLRHARRFAHASRSHDQTHGLSIFTVRLNVAKFAFLFLYYYLLLSRFQRWFLFMFSLRIIWFNSKHSPDTEDE